ncbi:MAG: YXWGXW repeat-containing protein [Proteobacteria bacterium]|nr:YXWGXW repeat-containing protein [Pseudomonadota bacterium]
MEVPRMRNIIRSLIPALALAALPVLPVTANAGIEFGLSVSFAPPPLPVYEQPPLPGPGYLWVPGYWGWNGYDYYWVPGTWALAPVTGYLWTPGFWGWGDGVYVWHAGYWGPHVGFYGGINYGFGYTGVGYEGGYWRGGDFCYNRAVNNVNNVYVTNVYNRTVVNNVSINHTSFNGGVGGVMARPTRTDLLAAHERHIGPSSLQREQESFARRDDSLRASVNHGRPPIAATPRPAAFNAREVVAARGAPSPRLLQTSAQYGDRPMQAERGNGFQYRNDRAVPQGQVSAQYRPERPVPSRQANAPQFRAERPVQASQVNAPQYRSQRPVQAGPVNTPPVYRGQTAVQPLQVRAPQPQYERPAPVYQPRPPQYSVSRAPQTAPAHPVNAPRPAMPNGPSRPPMQVGQAGNTHQNHGH